MSLRYAIHIMVLVRKYISIGIYYYSLYLFMYEEEKYGMKTCRKENGSENVSELLTLHHG